MEGQARRYAKLAQRHIYSSSSRENAVKTILLLLALTLAPIANAIDLPLLRDVICAHETRGIANHATALSPDALGTCQITPATAYFHGYRDVIAVLANNKELALEVLKRCARLGWRRLYALAFCYNGGPGARASNKMAQTYAMTITAAYKARMQQKL